MSFRVIKPNASSFIYCICRCCCILAPAPTPSAVKESRPGHSPRAPTPPDKGLLEMLRPVPTHTLDYSLEQIYLSSSNGLACKVC